MNVSIVIRTLNEARYLPELLAAIASQQAPGWDVETVIVDSGSTDGTLDIAHRAGCLVRHIRPEEFSFGRSLNLGCEAARGDVLRTTMTVRERCDSCLEVEVVQEAGGTKLLSGRLDLRLSPLDEAFDATSLRGLWLEIGPPRKNGNG